MTHLSKTAAMKLASRVVGKPSRRSQTDFVFYAPHNNSKLDGPDTEFRASSYPAIRGQRTVKMAYVALTAMGVDLTNVMLEVSDMPGDTTTVSSLIGDGIKQAKEAPTPQEQADSSAAYWASQQ